MALIKLSIYILSEALTDQISTQNWPSEYLISFKCVFEETEYSSTVK